MIDQDSLDRALHATAPRDAQRLDPAWTARRADTLARVLATPRAEGQRGVWRAAARDDAWASGDASRGRRRMSPRRIWVPALAVAASAAVVGTMATAALRGNEEHRGHAVVPPAAAPGASPMPVATGTVAPPYLTHPAKALLTGAELPLAPWTERTVAPSNASTMPTIPAMSVDHTLTRQCRALADDVKRLLDRQQVLGRRDFDKPAQPIPLGMRLSIGIYDRAPDLEGKIRAFVKKCSRSDYRILSLIDMPKSGAVAVRDRVPRDPADGGMKEAVLVMDRAVILLFARESVDPAVVDEAMKRQADKLARATREQALQSGRGGSPGDEQAPGAGAPSRGPERKSLSPTWTVNDAAPMESAEPEASR